LGAKELWDATKSIAFEDGASNRMLGKRCCPWFDKLTMRPKPLKLLYLILSLSKDGAKISAFFSILLKRTLEISLPASAFYQMEQLLIVH